MTKRADTYYTVLGVSRGATLAEIKTAYRELMRQVHPDVLPNASAYWKKQAEEKAKEINEAYEILSDSAKRRLYDHELDTYYRRPQAAQAQQPRAAPTDGNNQASQSRRTATASGGRKSTGRAAASGTTAHVIWAVFCLLWAAILLSVAYSLGGNSGFALVMAFAGFAWPAYMGRRIISKVLAKTGLTNQTGQAAATVILIIGSIIAIRAFRPTPTPEPSQLTAEEALSSLNFAEPTTPARPAMPAPRAHTQAAFPRSGADEMVAQMHDRATPTPQPSSPASADESIVDDLWLRIAIELALGREENEFCSHTPRPECQEQFRNSLKYKSIPLTPGGILGLVVELCLPGFEGSGGCRVEVLRKRPGGYEQVLENIGGLEEWEVAKTTNNGYYDLIDHYRAHSSAEQRYSYFWTGSRYELKK